jgi:transposase InsO family protein
MPAVSPAFSFLLAMLAGWMSQRQQYVIEYLKAENRMLKAKLKGRRIQFSDAERALLARKAKAVGRKALFALETVVSPDTLLRWHRRLIAQKWNFVHLRHRIGRPGVMREIETLVVRMATENPSWGYSRIQGALANLGRRVGRGTVANVLKRNGLEPSPRRGKGTSWSTFLKAHWETLAASDFLSVEVWTAAGLVTHHVLFLISLCDRAVCIGGITVSPHGGWMLQIGRNLTDEFDGALKNKAVLLLDRDAKYTLAFRASIERGGTRVIRLPPRSPNLNAYAERFVRSIKEECLDRMIFVGHRSLRRAIAEYIEHYHRERNHQGLGNTIPFPSSYVGTKSGKVIRKERLGGLLNYYERLAA